MDNDYFESAIKKINLILDNTNSKSILIFLIFIGFIFFILGTTQTNLINSNTVIIILFSVLGSYIYIKTNYTKQLSKLKIKNKILKNNSILDDICDNEDLSKKNSKMCSKYRYAKSNFYTISNLLLQKFNISD